MSIGQKVGAGLAAVALVVGVVVGFWPMTITTEAFDTVHCGSAFIPAAPSGTTDGEAWGSVLGYASTDTSADNVGAWQDDCTSARPGRLGPAIVLILTGLVGGWGVYEARKKSRDREATAVAEPQAASGQGSTTGSAPQGQVVESESKADWERRWREAGWAPVEEAEGPPPGWVKLPPTP